MRFARLPPRRVQCYRIFALVEVVKLQQEAIQVLIFVIAATLIIENAIEILVSFTYRVMCALSKTDTLI